jgi:hypothetical protein
VTFGGPTAHSRWLFLNRDGTGPANTPALGFTFRNARAAATIATIAIYTHLTEPTRVSLRAVLDRLMTGF